MKTLVIGLGNPILKDDGVGIYTARVVRAVLPPAAEVDVVELAVGGLALMEAMIGYERAILIDALWTMPGEHAGEIVEFDAGDLPETLNTRSAHDADLPTALRTGRRLGAQLPAQKNIQIVAIRAEDVLTFGETPNPHVAAAIPEAAFRVLTRLGYPPEEPLPPYHELTRGGYDDFA
jgi:hydrogenase maturation protease